MQQGELDMALLIMRAEGEQQVCLCGLPRSLHKHLSYTLADIQLAPVLSYTVGSAAEGFPAPQEGARMQERFTPARVARLMQIAGSRGIHYGLSSDDLLMAYRYIEAVAWAVKHIMSTGMPQVVSCDAAGYLTRPDNVPASCSQDDLLRVTWGMVTTDGQRIVLVRL